MKQFNDYQLKTHSIAIFRHAASSSLVNALVKLSNYEQSTEALSSAASIFSALCKNGNLSDLSSEVFNLLKKDSNPLSECYLCGITPKKELVERAKVEYEFFCSLAAITPDSIKLENSLVPIVPQWSSGIMPPFSVLISSYKKNGCGVFAQSCAFIWDESTKSMRAVEHINPIKLTQLKDYKEEKQQIIKNTEAFLKGMPANNILLYGDRGTGKSSTVHALLNKFASSGLRLLEVNKSAVSDFPLIISMLAKVKLRFIIFIDDLSFLSADSNYTELKAALEGSISRCKNILVYATSNRRHLLSESFSDRDGDDIHTYDTFEEQMSLSDRFGIVITFLNPEKQGFLSILRQILDDRKISYEDTFLMHLAERYAVKKGGRSPRAAKQLADMIEAAHKMKTEVEI